MATTTKMNGAEIVAQFSQVSRIIEDSDSILLQGASSTDSQKAVKILAVYLKKYLTEGIISVKEGSLVITDPVTKETETIAVDNHEFLEPGGYEELTDIDKEKIYMEYEEEEE